MNRFAAALPGGFWLSGNRGETPLVLEPFCLAYRLYQFDSHQLLSFHCLPDPFLLVGFGIKF